MILGSQRSIFDSSAGSGAHTPDPALVGEHKMSIGKSKRFQIFMRDCFTCQYCPSCADAIRYVSGILKRVREEEVN